MIRSIPAKDHRWKDIPGTNGKQQANPEGQVCSFTKNGKRHITEGYMVVKKTIKGVFVKIYLPERMVERKMSHVIWETFKGPIPEGYNVVHTDGVITNNRLTNLKLMTKSETGKMTGWKCSKRVVVKVDPDGEIVEFYYSAREAGRKNHMSCQTVLDRCNRRIKKPFALDGYNYLWEDDYFAKEGEQDDT